jgi:hypothetical protein
MAMNADPNAPAPGPDLVARNVGVIFGHRLGLDSEKLKLLRLTAGHRSFSCDLKRAAADVLSGARFTAWRYLVLNGGEVPLLEAEVAEWPGHGDWQVVSAAASPLLATEILDLTWLDGQPESTAANFEICYLRVPAGIARAWWLRGPANDQSEDLVLPMPGSHPDLRGYERTLFRATPFRAVVARLAQGKLDDERILFRGVPGF